MGDRRCDDVSAKKKNKINTLVFPGKVSHLPIASNEINSTNKIGYGKLFKPVERDAEELKITRKRKINDEKEDELFVSIRSKFDEAVTIFDTIELQGVLSESLKRAITKYENDIQEEQKKPNPCYNKIKYRSDTVETKKRELRSVKDERQTKIAAYNVLLDTMKIDI